MSKFFRTLLQRTYPALIAIPFKLMPSPASMAFNGQGSTAQLGRPIARQAPHRARRGRYAGGERSLGGVGAGVSR